MKSITFTALVLTGTIAVAAGITAVALANEPASHAAVNLQAKAITVKGTVVAVDGSPAAKASVYLRKNNLGGQSGGAREGGGAKAPELLAAQSGLYTTVAKTVTDADGKFEFRNVKQTGSMRLMVGDKMKTEWQAQTIKNNGDDIEIKKIQLRAALGGGGSDKDSEGSGRR